MWRAGKIAAAAVLSLAVLAGCGGRPPGVDGDLTDNWPAMAKAVTATPVSGTCYSSGYTETWIGDFDSRAALCESIHRTETVYVGTFTGALASGTNPPLPYSTDLADAYQDCSHRTEEFLGGSWQTGYLYLGLTLPSDAAWRGGARWYRCELAPLARDGSGDLDTANASLKDGLRGSRPAARTCMLIQGDANGSVTRNDAVDCAQPHNAEFAGLFTVHGTTYPSSDKALGDMERAGCQQVFRSFLGVASNQSRYFGYLYYDLPPEQWKLGVRTGLCAVVGFSAAGSPNNVRFTGSVKGFGNRKPTGWHT